MSAGGMALAAAETMGDVGERIVAYLDNFGRMEGVVARHFDRRLRRRRSSQACISGKITIAPGHNRDGSGLRGARA